MVDQNNQKETAQDIYIDQLLNFWKGQINSY